MKHVWYLGVALAVLLIVGQAQAVQFDFSFTSGIGISGSGILEATDLGGGTFLATSGSGTFTDLFGTNNATLFPNPLPDPTPPHFTTSPLGLFYYDDLLYPASTPYLDTRGLLFTYDSREINIWFDAGNTLYTYYVGDATGYPVAKDNSITFNLTPSPVPEPATMLLLGSGLLGLGMKFRKKFQKKVV